MGLKFKACVPIVQRDGAAESDGERNVASIHRLAWDDDEHHPQGEGCSGYSVR
jgi:hypothetical protein